MALPFTFSNVFYTNHNYFVGPFKETDQYVILVDSSDLTIMEVHSSPDNDPETWTEQDSADHPNLTGFPQAIWGHQDGNSIHIVTQEETSFRVGYSRFDTASHATPDNWGIVDEEVETPTDVGTSVETSCSIAARSDGTRVVLYNGSEDKVKGSPYARVDYNIRSAGGTWGGPVTVVANEKGEVDWFGSVIVLDTDNDMCHFFIKEVATTTNIAKHRSLTSGDSLSSIENVDTTVVGIAGMHVFGPGFYVLDGATHRVRVPYYDASLRITLARIDDDGSPQVTTDISDAQPNALNGSMVAALAHDGLDAWLLYSRLSDSDLYSDTAVTPHTGWTTDVEREDAVTINRISCNSYTRSGSKVLAWVEDNAGTIRYNELSLAAPKSALMDWYRNRSLRVYTR
jgi:hypothetical protein